MIEFVIGYKLPQLVASFNWSCPCVSNAQICVLWCSTMSCHGTWCISTQAVCARLADATVSSSGTLAAPLTELRRHLAPRWWSNTFFASIRPPKDQPSGPRLLPLLLTTYYYYYYYYLLLLLTTTTYFYYQFYYYYYYYYQLQPTTDYYY